MCKAKLWLLAGAFAYLLIYGGGKPKTSTPADKRLKENKPVVKPAPKPAVKKA